MRFLLILFLLPFCSFGQKADSIIARLPKRTPFIESSTNKSIPIYILNGVVFRVKSDSIDQKPRRIICIGNVGESSDPLYIVNGIPVDKKIVGKLKANDIKNIEVLQSPFAIAVYGSNGTNGVVLITTKELPKKKRKKQKGS